MEEEVLQMNEQPQKCFECQSWNAIIKVEGISLCNNCFYKQHILSRECYINKTNFIPDYNQITNSIYLGNEDTARIKEELNKMNISNIWICAENCDEFYPNDYVYLSLPLDDSPDENIWVWFYDAFKFIENSKRNVYIHCVMGISRSSSFVIGYLMIKNKWGYDRAYEYVKSKRNVIEPNSGFVTQWKEFEKKLTNFVDGWEVAKQIKETYNSKKNEINNK